MARSVRIANCSGFYGDRLAAAREVVSAGPLDVLTGDWLAELTLLILARARLKRGPGSGYARTFLDQMDDVLGQCLRRGIKVVSNAGGVDPAGLARALQELAVRRGLRPRIAYVLGDDLVPRIDDLSASGESWLNLDTGERFSEVGVPPLTANAYLGAFGIKAALDAGADVVITGRVTDASLVVGPGAWFHGWSPDDLDVLAGATVAGHLVECGTQVTGGNFAFFDRVPGLGHVGFPVAELADDGSSVITKQPGSGGVVDLDTVTAQLLYEIDSPRYLGPDVVSRFDSVRLASDGADRVAVSGTVGEPPPDRLKVALNYLGGFRNTVTFVLTGADVDLKAQIVVDQLFDGIDGGREAFDEVDVQLHRHTDLGPDAGPSAVPVGPASLWQAQAELRVTVKSRDPNAVGRPFTAKAVELTLASVPGLFLPGPPPEASPFGVYWPTTVAASAVEQTVLLVEPVLDTGSAEEAVEVARVASGFTGSPGTTSTVPSEPPGHPPVTFGESVPTRLGVLVGARSGDKGGNANIGVWVRNDHPDRDRVYAWLCAELTPKRLVELMPEAAGLVVDRFELPNVAAVNFVIRGMLGRGVAENTALDPQGKGLSEYLRAVVVDIPTVLVPSEEELP
ncbi:MAG: acyclic terpene utilization AtuA family protein [Actinomycetes bacterium]